MNLVKISIANFKQYVEPVEIEIPSQAAIGIIGANGVGKTTLFQAIEWCLYNPTSIPANDIRPRGLTGNPKVVVTLQSRDGSRRWEVERERKRSTTTAAIYEIGEDGTATKIVDGTKDVTRYVESHLIDLSHRAFVATFFTRQKELHFFGDLSDTDRRREVGKLLGLETIRAAQQSIGKDRLQAGNHAKFAREQYERAVQGRDLPAEIATATSTVTSAAADIAATHQQAIAAATASDIARTHFTAQQQRRDRYTVVKGEQDQTQRDLSAAVEQLATREKDIARFNDLRSQREQLVPAAAGFAARDETVRQFNAQRERHRLRGDVQRRIDRAQHARATALAAIRRDVETLADPSRPSDWHWNEADDTDPQRGVSRLQRVSDAQPVEASVVRVALFRHAHSAAAQHQEAVVRLGKFRERLTQLVRELDNALKDGSPEDALKAIDAQEADLTRQETEWATERRGLEEDRQRRQRVLDNLEASNFDDGCPTCGRPFSGDDASTAIDIFRRDIAGLHQRIQAGDKSTSGIRQKRDDLIGQRGTVEQRRQQLEQVRANLVKGRGATDEQEKNVEAAAEAMSTALATAGCPAAPTNEDLATAERAESLARAMSGAVDRLRLHLANVDNAAADIAMAESEIAAFGDVTYDGDAHDRAIRDRDEAQKAQAAIAGYDRELSQEQATLEHRATLATRISELEQALAEARQHLFEVGYDPEMLQAAETALGLAERQEKDAQAIAHRAELDHQRAESALTTVQAEHDRLRATLQEADDRLREADELKQMYDEFAAFEQWVVARLTPQLGELTSAIVAQVTDGRYDEVTFDENFGVHVRDGEDAYPLVQFSGGERDVIALAARLALSQLIGAQASEQPGFLVLDEVFGSLDRDRRMRLLELLGSLGSVSDRFQQVFIISHVDDVRSAPVLDDLWMVRETSPGTSTIDSLTPGTDIGEL